jgi:hypothetical protein
VLQANPGQRGCGDSAPVEGIASYKPKAKSFSPSSLLSICLSKSLSVYELTL